MDRRALGEAPDDGESLLLLGVFSVAAEREQRNAVRDTWARYPQVCLGTAPAAAQPPPPAVEQQPGGPPPGARRCDVRVVFVLGRFGDGAAGDALRAEAAQHGDLVELRCAENMNQGKSLEWLRHASAMLAEGAEGRGARGAVNATAAGVRAVRAVAVGKADSDTFVYVPQLVAQLRAVGSVTALEHVYMGHAITWHRCGRHDYCPRDYTYMQGQLYVLGRRVAAWVAAEFEAGALAAAGPEDMVVGGALQRAPAAVPVLHWYCSNADHVCPAQHWATTPALLAELWAAHAGDDGGTPVRLRELPAVQRTHAYDLGAPEGGGGRGARLAAVAERWRLAAAALAAALLMALLGARLLGLQRGGGGSCGRGRRGGSGAVGGVASAGASVGEAGGGGGV